MQKLIIIVVLMAGAQGATWATERHEPIGHEVVQRTLAQTDWSSWGLSPVEMHRLQQIESIERAFTVTERLTPFELLGKYAETSAERDRYARLYVQANLDHRVRSLEWAVAVAKVLNVQKHSDALLASPQIKRYLESHGYKGYIDNGTAALQQVSTTVRERRLHVFVKSHDCKSCDVKFKQAIKAMDNRTTIGIDVVFVGMVSQDQNAATQWALRNGITPEQVSAGTITLNYENAYWKAERRDRAVPLVIEADTGHVVN